MKFKLFCSAFALFAFILSSCGEGGGGISDYSDACDCATKINTAEGFGATKGNAGYQKCKKKYNNWSTANKYCAKK